MTEVKKSCRVFISRTEREWKAIDLRLKNLGRSDLHAYINGRLSLLQKQFNVDPSSIYTSVQKRVPEKHHVPEAYTRMLNMISIKTGVPISTIVDRLIIDPLINLIE